ncbi:MAG: hypothetical protein A2481_01245 [Candidatus Yonathbacteria bacterium RIFOXYC2_FULL_47_9]|nr:MAG: hypothetical protein A2481_01245 [Candidatus Yonathbacteria bacterium RIFOXYC2_FULL_47_9]HAT68070.1 hypothetical protein [Candidatus Yonathbacteria bacterium]
MKYLVALLVAFFAFALPAHAALVFNGAATGPGGLSIPYPTVNPEMYAGFVEFDYNGKSILMMSDDYTTGISVDGVWTTNLYTYADVAAGTALVKFSSVQYAQVGWIWGQFGGFSQGFLDSFPDSGVRAGMLAAVNEAVWKIMNPGAISLGLAWDAYPTLSSELYTLATDGTHDTFNWSNIMVINSLTGDTSDEWLVSVSSVPEPRSSLLLLSGLLLVGYVAKRKGLQQARFK